MRLVFPHLQKIVAKCRENFEEEAVANSIKLDGEVTDGEKEYVLDESAYEQGCDTIFFRMFQYH